MEIGQNISIVLSIASNHCRLGTSSLIGIITNETEKAIEITLDNGSFSNTAKAWFPKKAILNKNGFYQLAHWFRPNMYLTKIFNNFSHHSIIAV